MALLDKVSGELNLYIGGCVLNRLKIRWHMPILAKVKWATPPKKNCESDNWIDCSLSVERNRSGKPVLHMYFLC